MARLPDPDSQKQKYPTTAPKAGKQSNGTRSDEAKARDKAKKTAQSKLKIGVM